MCPASLPSSCDLRQILAEAEPEIGRILRRWRISEDEAEDLITCALIGVLLRWERIHNHREWVLRAIEKEARRRRTAHREEPDHGR
ncbi:MAG TPA: hypothetical protein VEL74_20990 [Thermoanaerobaculia bacterium]|nr:hypothetical protein [Thermoanaerobaculia bacterium]